jgi:hypothetical protein
VAVYAIVEAHDASRVKLGRALVPQLRLAELQCGNPDRLALLACSRHTTEAQLHRRYRGLRLSGEWFGFSREMFFSILREWDWLDMGLEQVLFPLVLPSACLPLLGRPQGGGCLRVMLEVERDGGDWPSVAFAARPERS